MELEMPLYYKLAFTFMNILLSKCEIIHIHYNLLGKNF